ncbi:MAG: Tat pathway signal protein [Acidobacteriota bacterium]|nr:Tat pathway signal protein [Acidobacteriota bacterium]
MRRTSAAFAALLFFFGAACQTTADAPRRRAAAPAASIDDLERRTFRWFWDTANPRSYLVPDRWPTQSFSSIAAVGFGLTAYCIGAERGYVTRDQARDRVLATLRSLLAMPEGAQAAGVTQYRGFFYHFLDMETGARYKDVELSTIDSTWLFSGALFCQSYFDRDDPSEKAIRDAVEQMYGRAEWDWAAPRSPAITMGWTPEHGFHTYDWRGYNEAMMVVILALGSPTHPVDASAWNEWTKSYKWGTFYGQEHLLFAPLFGHQYTQMFIDFRGIQDAYMRAHGIDYFENSRRATLSQRAYANDNPGHWKDYGGDIWGLTACDGPGDTTIDGRTYMGYAARGAAPGDIRDDGTIAPTAAASSIPFTPEISIAAIQEMQRRYGSRLYREYGFADAFNPTFQSGWFDADYLGIDQGPIIAMIENYRSGLVWEKMKKNPHVIRGLRRAGFTGGWLG